MKAKSIGCGETGKIMGHAREFVSRMKIVSGELDGRVVAIIRKSIAELEKEASKAGP